ncbi:MAG TPA: glycosyltransferase family 4 protein [Lacunisphaera sp.]|jgi:glycosyltransferase involved in cell wall biosynthesis
MRILFLAHSFYPESTGVSRVAGSIASAAARDGHIVTVGTGGSDRETETDLNGVRVERFSCGGNLVQGLTGNIAEYREFVRSHSADIVVLHCAQTWTTDALLEVWDQLAKPIVLVSHGLSAFKSEAYRDYFRLLAEKLKGNGRVVGLSERLEEVVFCHDFGLSAPEIIPNGVDYLEWSSPTTGIRDQWGIGDKPWIISPSNHSTVKNHSRFWHVLSSLAESTPLVQGSIVGRPYGAARFHAGRVGVKGGCWYGCKLRSIFSDRVLLHDRATRKEVVSAVKEADVLAVTSSREAAPLVLLESMAAGVPWVSFRVGSVEDNAGGIVVDTELEMVHAMQSLLKDRKAARALGEAGRKQILQRHDWRTIAKAHIELYRDCIYRYGFKNKTDR